MARRMGGGSMVGGQGGMITPVISIATGLLIFVILQIFAPTIGGSIETVKPDLKETCYIDDNAPVYFECTGASYENISTWSEWNVTHNPDLPNGSETWTTNTRILGVVILIISIAIAMYYLKGM